MSEKRVSIYSYLVTVMSSFKNGTASILLRGDTKIPKTQLVKWSKILMKPTLTLQRVTNTRDQHSWPVGTRRRWRYFGRKFNSLPLPLFPSLFIWQSAHMSCLSETKGAEFKLNCSCGCRVAETTYVTNSSRYGTHWMMQRKEHLYI